MVANPLSPKDSVATLVLLRLAAVIDKTAANALYAVIAKTIPTGYCLQGIDGNKLVFTKVEAEPRPKVCCRRWHADPCVCGGAA